jgi:hypothetical protein
MAFGDFTVTRASTKNILGDAGLYVSVANDTPAFEFNTDGSYRGLLVELGATNLALRSQEFDNASWTKENLNTTGTPAWVNVGVAPDGTTTAEKLIPDTTSSNLHRATQANTIATATYTFSVFAKADGYNFVKISHTNGMAAVAVITFSLIDGTFVNTGGTDGFIGASAQLVGSGWWRLSFTFSANSGSRVASIAPMDNNTNSAFVGDGTSGIFIWQAQLETGSVATSPIYTVASTVARTTDDISLTSASSLIGQTEGTIYLETNTRTVSTIADMVAVSGVGLYVLNISQSNGNIQLYSEPDMDLVVIKTGDNRGIPLKMAFAYMSGSFAFYVNGVQEWTSASVTPATSLDSISLAGGSNRGVSHHGSFALFPTRLSNAQLSALTTL